MDPDPVIPDHALRQGAGVLVTVLAVMLVLTNLSVHIVKTTQTLDNQNDFDLFILEKYSYCTCSNTACAEVLMHMEYRLCAVEALGVLTHGAIYLCSDQT